MITRKYTGELPDYADVFTIEEWKEATSGQSPWITTWDGNGYWVKDSLESNDEAFSTPQLDATHVAWYNK